ncbi:hypothetical protein B0H14DRAFT_3453847 [Mycena olivaceomarginata]|nr:hypothetical protein B0H14DRAFT_3453847 [Mycena olivaceomarginata]
MCDSSGKHLPSPNLQFFRPQMISDITAHKKRKREVEERSADVTLDLHCRRRPIGESGHCSGTAPKEWDSLIAHDSLSKSGPRTAFNVELSRRVSREKLELTLRGEVHAAKELQRLAETSALPSPAVKQAINLALQRSHLTVKQQNLEGFILKIKALIARLEDTESRQEKEGILEVLRLMLKSPIASVEGNQRAFIKAQLPQNKDDQYVLVISNDEGEGSESESQFNPGQLAAAQLMLEVATEHLASIPSIPTTSAFVLSEEDRIRSLEREIFALRTRAQARQAAAAGEPVENPEQPVRVPAAPALAPTPTAVSEGPRTILKRPATRFAPPPAPEEPEHPFANARDAAYAPPRDHNIGTRPTNSAPAKKPDPAYRTTAPIYDEKVANSVFDRSMDAPITLTQRELLSLSPEVRA